MPKSEFYKKLLVIPGIALGVLVLFFIVKFKPEPQRNEVQEIAHSVRIITAPEVAVVPRALGYGMVQAGQTWENENTHGRIFRDPGEKIRQSLF